ncbi:MAG: NADH-quinone oxidoreductase subunit N [Anaerolineae bacterium]|nr:NADH-quinone oxidoreductase subunit N [Anaerolineae bacterium]
MSLTSLPDQSLIFLLPELILLGAILLILAVDLLAPVARRWILYLSLLGVVGAGGATVSLWGVNRRVFAVLSLDNFALSVNVIALIAVAVVIMISKDYAYTNDNQPALFYTLLLFSAINICFLGAATNLVMIMLCFDFLSIGAYILTGFPRGDLHANEAALKYFLYGSTLSAVLLYAMSWLYGFTGSTDLVGIAQGLQNWSVEAIQQGGSPLVFVPLLVLMVAGLSYKVAAAPFHQWAPDVYEGAPLPVAAFISVGPKLAGLALFVRVTLVLFPATLQLGMRWRWPLLGLIAVSSMTFGNLAALWQDNIKRLLAYSSIAQVGYMLIGITVASEDGIAAVLFYMLAYVFANLGIFTAITIYESQTGAVNIGDYAGAHKRAPFLAFVTTFCLLALVGFPTTGGFVGKLGLFAAAIKGGLGWLALLAVINSVISLAYYWRVIRAMYFTPLWTESPVEISGIYQVALGVTLGGVLFLGLLPQFVLPLFQAAAHVFFSH